MIRTTSPIAFISFYKNGRLKKRIKFSKVLKAFYKQNGGRKDCPFERQLFNFMLKRYGDFMYLSQRQKSAMYLARDTYNEKEKHHLKNRK